jgi:hypothetical protein
MSDNVYHFVTHWRVHGTCAEVSDILENSAELPRWWPSVYLEAEVLCPGGEHALGQEVRLFTKGWLPYTLRWDFTVSEVRYPHGSRIEARGDFVGRGIWTFVQDGDIVDVTYDWKISAEKPLLRALTPLLRPIFAANHRWAMAQGERSLELELRRVHAQSDGERRAVPLPPGPTFYRPQPVQNLK